MNEIVIHEVGLRDGLQMEKEVVPTEKKLEWTEKLIDSGIDIIQLGSFVHPKYVPQMADTDKLFEIVTKKFRGKAVFSGLVLNEKGMERGMNCGVELFCMGVSASETHSMKNTKMTTEEAQVRIINIAKETMNAGKKVQASVQSAFGCGFEGDIPEDRVIGIIAKYLEAGINTISLADTAGMAEPFKVRRMFEAIGKLGGDADLTCHFHNTYGLGMANIYSAMQSGVRNYETAFGGLGGCPFTKVAAGNVCTEDFIYFLKKNKMRDDVNIKRIISIVEDASVFFNKSLPGYVYNIIK